MKLLLVFLDYMPVSSLIGEVLESNLEYSLLLFKLGIFFPLIILEMKNRLFVFSL